MNYRKIIAMLGIICIVFLPFNSFAIEIDSSDLTSENISSCIDDVCKEKILSHLEGEESEIVPFYNTVCGSLPYHRMVARGRGYVMKKNKTMWIDNGNAWQCPTCGLVMVTQGDLYAWGMDTIGRYATLHNQEPTNINGCFIYGADFYGYTSKNRLDGYRFFLN